MFKDNFVDIGKDVAESIGGNNNNHLDYMAHIKYPNSFSFGPINCDSTEIVTCSLKNKYSNLNTTPIKKSDIFSPCLTNINTGTPSPQMYFRITWKKARVMPIPKETDKCNLIKLL